MHVPDDLMYSADHEWVRREGDLLRIGITDYAQDSLGDVVYVDAPKVGTAVTSGQTMGEVESTKAVSELYAPVSGEVVEVNEALGAEPERLNRDPYGDGWLCVIRPASDDFGHLHDADAYRALVGA